MPSRCGFTPDWAMELPGAIPSCKSLWRSSRFEWKPLHLDSRILYWGSGNLTQATLNHRDLMQRLTGPAL